MVNRRKCCLVATVSVGAFLLVAGCVFIPVSERIIHRKINQRSSLKNPATYKSWLNADGQMQVWVWDLTNPDEVRQGGKPALIQKGPYSYRVERHKENITFNDNNTVSYRERRDLYFDRKSSVGPETDTFTSVNVPMMSMAHIIHKEYGWLKDVLEVLMEWANEDIFVVHSVKELLWGYEEPLLNKTAQLLSRLGLPVHLHDHFALFKNYTDNGYWNMDTGEEDPSRSGYIYSWNYKTTLPFWTSSHCNLLAGTRNSNQFSPFLKRSDTLGLIVSDLCRTIYMQYDGDVTLKGVPLYRFYLPPTAMASATIDPDNRGYCTPTNYCLPSGLLNIETCKKGAPLILSQPHFLNADSRVLQSVNGMHPDESTHGSYVDVEPNLGTAFSLQKRIQMNLQLQPVDKLRQTEKLRTVVLPVLWFNDSALATDADLDHFKSAFQTPEKVIHIGIYVLIGLGTVLLLTAFVFLVKIRCSSGATKKGYEPLLGGNVQKDDPRKPLVSAVVDDDDDDDDVLGGNPHRF